MRTFYAVAAAVALSVGLFCVGHGSIQGQVAAEIPGAPGVNMICYVECVGGGGSHSMCWSICR